MPAKASNNPSTLEDSTQSNQVLFVIEQISKALEAWSQSTVPVHIAFPTAESQNVDASQPDIHSAEAIVGS
ncbi:MAG: hypothetical protein CL912_18525 [Deltaproteobacteria bacterium]|nr:hypothetical protein [Deltaproteobacteria bacterium]